jgi:predicted transglutaminase-like cysteine proteinase
MSRIYGVPLATLAAGAGDCEDYAIAKIVALREAGVAPEDLRLVIMRNTLSGEDHAVVAARLEGHWRLLDNRYLAMLEDVQIRRYHPIFLIDQHEVRRFAEPPSSRQTS